MAIGANHFGGRHGDTVGIGDGRAIRPARTPPEARGLSEDDYEVVGNRVDCRLAALEYRHVVICHRYVTVKVRGSDRPVSAPACEGVSRSGRADLPFVAGMPVDRFMWHLPPARHHRQPRLPEPVGQPRHLPSGAVPRGPVAVDAGSAVIQMVGTPIRAGWHPGKPRSMRKGHLWPAPGDRGEIVLPFPDSSRHGNAVRFPGGCSGTLVTDGHRAYEAHLSARGGAVTHQTCWSMPDGTPGTEDTHPEMAGEALDLIGAIHRTGREIVRLVCSGNQE